MLNLDGSVADVVTIGVGVLAALCRPVVRRFRGIKRCFRQADIGRDFLNGVTIVPFCMLIGSVASSQLLREVMAAKISMAIAGVIGLIFVLGELRSTNDDERP